MCIGMCIGWFFITQNTPCLWRFELLCTVPFARSRLKSPEVHSTQFSLDKAAVIGFYLVY